MDTSRIRILNFDQSVTRQKEFISRFDPQIIDLTSLHDASRLWTNRNTAQKIIRALDHSHQDAVTFVGSGDFHHISSLLISQFAEPLTVIVFDFHPDWDVLPPHLGCGSWVSAITRQPHVKKSVLLGPSSHDLDAQGLLSADLASLKDDRIEIYPYAHKPSRVFFRNIPNNISIRAARKGLSRQIVWDQLQGKDMQAFFHILRTHIPPSKVYISIDKDCLKPEYALTNWEPGFFDREEVLLLLHLINTHFEIVGVDVTGEYSYWPQERSMKAFCSRLDHPSRPSAQGRSPQEIDLVNQQTNIKIIETLMKG